MAASEHATVPASVSRLKREDYKRTKHDPHFSKWQVLIGPSDWEDYSQGKEGGARYRVHNLPTGPGPGLYELGVSVSRSGLRSECSKLDPDDIVAVYLGQADNVRTRLQHYGRSGAHLGNSYATGHWDASKTASSPKATGLFEEIFVRGYSIVFRWAPMKDKRNAEKIEAQLLDTFDYAWNKGSNGTRRPNDILQKLGKIASSNSRFSSISKRLLFMRPSEVGIKIESTRQPHADGETKSFLHGIFKFSRSQPRSVSTKSATDDDLNQTCGFIMSDAIACTKPPVHGRKRCAEHRGMRNYAADASAAVCGVNLGDGDFCRRTAMPGRKRCEEHSGMRIKGSRVPAVKVTTANEKCGDEELYSVCGATMRNGSVCRRRLSMGHKRCWQHRGKRVDCTITGLSSSCETSKLCGVGLENGSICMNVPVQGRKRCEQHKGMRVCASRGIRRLE